MTPEDAEWVLAHYEDAVADSQIRHLALQIAEASHVGEGAITVADLEGARPYLRACFKRMSLNEVAGLSATAVASLWARGTVGAFRYRMGLAAAAPAGVRSRRRRFPSGKRVLEHANGGTEEDDS